MPQALPPTVHGRLSICNERVFVDGLLVGALVELHVDATILSVIANGAHHTFTVPLLTEGAEVKTRQDAGVGFTSFSASIIVENAFVPPESAPSIPEEIGACSQCVLVNHATPGALIQAFVENSLVGEGLADRHGSKCLSIDLRELRGKAGPILSVRQVVCGVEGPFTSRALFSLPNLPKPHIGSPVFSCQNRVPVSNARGGALLRFETDGGDDLGSLCSCWNAVNVGLTRPLVVGELVRTRCEYNGSPPCTEIGSWSSWRPVEAPDERIKPEIREVLYEGDQVIRVANQISGSTLVIKIAPTAGDIAVEFGPRPASEEEEISLADKLSTGNQVIVEQSLCGISVSSDPVIVRKLPPEIFAPVVRDPLFDCGNAVQVSNLHPGAFIQIFMDDIPIETGWSGLEHSKTISVSPKLVAGREVTARQWLGGSPSPMSTAVQVREIETLSKPRVLGPVAKGDQTVWLSGVTPGAHVIIRSKGLLDVGSTIIGEADAAEPILQVPINNIVGSQEPLTVFAQVRLCDKLVSGDRYQEVILSPCAIPSQIKVTEETIEFETFDLPGSAAAPDMMLRGQLYKAEGQVSERMPLVVVAHGWHTGISLTSGEIVDSFKGYDYLAQHLARWGMIVFSIDLQPVNEGYSVATVKESHDARAEIIFRTITLLEQHQSTSRIIDLNRIGLIGHSMGGEAVAHTHFINETQNRGFGIKGSVSIAPTNWLNTNVLPNGKYMQLFGSVDQLTTFVPSNDTPSAAGGMRIYDRAQRDKTFFWLHGMRHNPFNSLWVGAGDYAEEHLPDLALSEGEHQRLSKCLINAFFQDSLMGRSNYAEYMEGQVLPQSIRHLDIHASHSKEPRTVIDNFGDKDDQANIAAEGPLDKTVNSTNNTVLGSGADFVEWEDLRHSSISNSPHVTTSVMLAWQGSDAVYRSDTGGVATVSDDAISLRLAQFYENTTFNAYGQPADAFISVSDGTETASVRLGAAASIPFPDTAPVVLSVMRTIRLPLDSFQAVNQLLDLNDIRSIELRFNAKPAGKILGDDFEVSS